MRVVRHGDNTEAFMQATGDFLLADEVAHNTILSIVRRVQAGNHPYEDVFLAHVEDNSDIVLVAMRTVPYGPVLSNCTNDTAIEIIADTLKADYHRLPYVLGTPHATEVFAAHWQALSGQPYHVQMEQGVYACENVIPPQNVPGEARSATRDDMNMLVKWAYQFSRETGVEPDYTMQQAHENIEGKLNKPVLCGILLWTVDNQPVSMAAATRESQNMGVVSLVYTPPEKRGNGYASAATAAVTQQILKQKQYATLYTDLDNPTSNKIYQAIGYQHVCNHRMMAFDAT